MRTTTTHSVAFITLNPQPVDLLVDSFCFIVSGDAFAGDIKMPMLPLKSTLQKTRVAQRHTAAVRAHLSAAYRQNVSYIHDDPKNSKGSKGSCFQRYTGTCMFVALFFPSSVGVSYVRVSFRNLKRFNLLLHTAAVRSSLCSYHSEPIKRSALSLLEGCYYGGP